MTHEPSRVRARQRASVVRVGGSEMKHLLSGVALGAVLAIALPLWGQAPSTPPSAAPPTASSTAPPSSTASSTQPPPASDKPTAAPRTTASGGAHPTPPRQGHRGRAKA